MRIYVAKSQVWLQWADRIHASFSKAGVIDKSILSLAFRTNAVDGIETGTGTVVGGCGAVPSSRLKYFILRFSKIHLPSI